MSIELMMPSNHFILCFPLLLLPSVFPSIRVFPMSSSIDAWRAQTKLCAPGPRRKEQWPHKRLSQTSLWVFRSLWWTCGLTVACCRLRGIDSSNPGRPGVLPKSFGRRTFYHLPLPLPPPGQSTGREESPTHKQKIGLKIYWTWPCPPKQNPVLPTASPSHQETCTGLLSASIRRQTEWKPQSQKTNQNDHMNHNFV